METLEPSKGLTGKWTKVPFLPTDFFWSLPNRYPLNSSPPPLSKARSRRTSHPILCLVSVVVPAFLSPVTGTLTIAVISDWPAPLAAGTWGESRRARSILAWDVHTPARKSPSRPRNRRTRHTFQMCSCNPPSVGRLQGDRVSFGRIRARRRRTRWHRGTLW